MSLNTRIFCNFIMCGEVLCPIITPELRFALLTIHLVLPILAFSETTW